MAGHTSRRQARAEEDGLVSSVIEVSDPYSSVRGDDGGAVLLPVLP